MSGWYWCIDDYKPAGYELASVIALSKSAAWTHTTHSMDDSVYVRYRTYGGSKVYYDLNFKHRPDHGLPTHSTAATKSSVGGAARIRLLAHSAAA